MESGVLTVLNRDILPFVSTGGPRIANAARRSRSVYTADWGPSWSLGSTGPIVKLGTADITEVDHENLIFMETPEASAASDARLQSDHSRFLSPSATNGLQSYYANSPDLLPIR